MIHHHIIYRLYIWLYDKNGCVLKESLFEASSVFLLLIKVVTGINRDKFLGACKNADNIRLALTDNKGVELLPVYSEIFIKRCHECGLSAREKEVMFHKTKGLSDKMVADNLCIDPGTVNSHLKNIFEKLGAHNIIEAIYKLNH